MGQKVHPYIFRLGTTTMWYSRWFARRHNYATFLREDVMIRNFLTQELRAAGVDRIDVERGASAITVIITAAKPGFIIGRAGVGAEALKDKLRKKFFPGRKVTINVNIQEVTRPALSAHVVMQGMIEDLEKRTLFRRVLRQAVTRVEKAGAQGVKVGVAGRLNGAEIARTEVLARGKVPLHTLRADIDYAQGFARTIYGTIGVKVWINRGEIFAEKAKVETEKK